MDALAANDIVLFEDFRLDRRGGGLFRRDQPPGVLAPIAIGARALDVLGVLVERAGDLVTRNEIIALVWPSTVVEDNNLNMQVAALRRVLDDRRVAGSCIQTVAGRGYRFIPPITRVKAEPHANGPAATPHAGARPRLSVVVLPFANLSGDPEQQYFADGVTADLTSDLSRIEDMFVISCNSAFAYRDKRIDTRQIGRELGVRYALEGSVRRFGKQVRVNAQLIDAETDAHLWAERLSGDTGDLFALHDEIASLIAVALKRELVGAEAARQTEHPDAVDYILRGRAAVVGKPPTRAARAEAIELFQRALALDPGSVAARGRLAIQLAARVLDDMTDTAAADIVCAEALVEQALAAAPRSSLARFAKGQVLRAQNRYGEAIAEYEAVITHDRNWVSAYAHIGQCKLCTGSIEEVIPLVEQTIRLSPRDPELGIWYMRVGQVHLLQSRIDEAIRWLEKARNASLAHSNIRAWLASAYAHKGEIKSAAAELAEARRLSADGRYSSLARARSSGLSALPSLRTLFEPTYFAGLRKAGMPEEC